MNPKHINDEIESDLIPLIKKCNLLNELSLIDKSENYAFKYKSATEELKKYIEDRKFSGIALLAIFNKLMKY